MTPRDYYLSGKKYDTLAEQKQAAIHELNMMNDAMDKVPTDASFYHEMSRLQAIITEISELEAGERVKN